MQMKSTAIQTLVILLLTPAINAQTFTRITEGDIVNDGGNSQGCSWGDYDGDGDPDLFVANDGEPNFLYQNNGDDTFSKVTTGLIVQDSLRYSSGSWGDFDNDGDLDLFVAILGSNALYRNSGTGNFARIFFGGGNSSGGSWADIDNDGDLDLFVATRFVNESSGLNNLLYRNDGAGGFTPVSVEPTGDGGDSQGVAWSDYDNDGDLDLFVANSGNENNFLYENTGQGGFRRIMEGAVVNDGGSSFGASWGDYNNDGFMDLVVANLGVERFYRNAGDGTFLVDPPSELCCGDASLGSAWGDYDNDGDLDLFIANSPLVGTGHNDLVQNLGNGFARVNDGLIVSDGGNSKGAAWADYDNDGDLDLFVANSDGENNFLYRNERTGNHFLNLALTGTESNTSAIGAKVRARATIAGSTVRQFREISGQTGYLSQNSLNAHFGLADATSVDSVRIEWPSGVVNQYANVVADTFLVLRENVRPTAVQEFPVVTLSQDTPEFVHDLSAEPMLFVDSEEDPLTYTAVSSDTNIVTVEVVSPMLTISITDEILAGRATVTVIADDGRADDGRGSTEEMFVDINRPPYQLRPIADQTILLRENPDNITLVMRDFVRDPEGDALTYSASTSDTSVARVLVTGDILAILAGSDLGAAVITVTADDQRGGTTQMSFDVNSIPLPTPPRLTGVPIPDQTLILGRQPFRQDLSVIFADDDGDSLRYSTSNSNPGIAIARVEADTLIVSPIDTGMADITVRANDGLGGEVPLHFAIEVLRSFRPVITHEPEGLEPAGEEISVESDIRDDEGALSTVSLNYRMGGETTFESIAMDTVAVNDTTFRASAVIPASAVTSRAVEYFIVAIDNHNVQARYPPSGIVSIQVEVGGEGVSKSTPQPGAGSNEQTAYRLISIPLDLIDQDPRAVLEDDLGAYDPTQWRLFQWLPLAGGGVAKGEFPDQVSAMSPGTAFWLIVKQSGRTIDTGPGITVFTSENDSVDITPGWNLVGNPFNFPTVAEPRLTNGGSFQLHAYENGVWSDVLDPETAEFEPFGGYALLSNTAGTLLIKANPGDREEGGEKRSGVKESAALWAIRIQAQCQDARDNSTRAAVHPAASNGMDPFDYAEPPGVGEYVSVYFPHPEWEALSARFSTDVRPEPEDVEEWTFEIATNISDAVELTFSGLEDVPAHLDILLIDKALRTGANLRLNPHYAVAGRGVETPKQLTLAVGRPASLNERFSEFQTVPATYELLQNFPNPFNPVTTIQFGLPAPGRVTLKVFNVLGEEVATLIEDELRGAGYHALVWDGRSFGGTRAASGIYFYRLQATGLSSGAAGFVRTGKMILMQ